MKKRELASLTSIRLFPTGVIALSALFLSACDRGGPPHGFPPAAVSVITVEAKTVPATFEYVGQTAGSREVEVRARVTGIVLKRNYREGGQVESGQSLFTIDPAPYQAAAMRAEADLAAAEARAGQAKRNAARLKPLFEAKAVSQKEHDDAVSGESVAEADVKAAQARLTEAKLNLGYTRVESPIAGIASRAQRSEGNYISGPDVLLTTVSQIHPIHVLFGISDDQRLRMNREVEEKRLVLPKNNQFDVSLKLAEGSLYAKTGKLDFADVRISGTTGTSEARAALPNQNGSLHPGQFVRVILKGAVRPNAILVPQRAVLEGPKGKFVYVVNEGKADARPVAVGDWQDDNWIILSGINPGDKVIVDGVMKIGPGAPVQVADPNAPPGAPPGAAAPAPSSAPAEAKPNAPTAAPAKKEPAQKKPDAKN
jgi:membrane fusion protein (multidrug efflux system)